MEQVLAIGAEQICPVASQVTSELVTIAHQKGLEVRAWGISDEGLMTRAVQAGVDGMTINFPDKLIASLRASRRAFRRRASPNPSPHSGNG
jgi:glycerophosphoryl diester phosphodiesterase